MKFDIKEAISKLPETFGVYIMKNDEDEVIYVGKAKVLKNRVSQYFRNYKSHQPKVRAMIDHIYSFEYIITDNELEALILECNLIKKYKPHYNILLRDDKTYPYIKVTTGDKYPRVIKVRKVIKDGSKYFGPYTNISAVNETLDIITKIYPIRTCNYDMDRYIKSKLRPCLEYYIKRCVGPCTGKIDEKEYKVYVDEIIKFLSGNTVKVKELLTQKMIEASQKLNFELAAQYRDKLKSIDDTLLTQKVTDVNLTKSRDVLAIASDSDVACITVFFIRNGRIIGRENFILEGVKNESQNHIIEKFLEQYYSLQKFIPNEIISEKEIYSKDEIEYLLSEISTHSVKIHTPKRGEKLELVNLVKKNAVEYLNKYIIPRNKSLSKIDILEELKNTLVLDDIPTRIESYDISHIQGTNSVGAMVVYKDGKKDYKEYRRYKLSDAIGNNDILSIKEVLQRRLKYGNYPDLILVDGGRNQVNAVKEVIHEYGLNIDVWGMYKDDRHITEGLINEEASIKLKKSSDLYKFLAGIQNEVHRYAITYHKSLRDKSMTKSNLDSIKGIGNIKKRNLLIRFKTIDAIAKASIDELKQVKGITESLAIEIKNTLK